MPSYRRKSGEESRMFLPIFGQGNGDRSSPQGVKDARGQTIFGG